MGSVSENCTLCAITKGLKNCSQVLESCAIQKLCNLNGDFVEMSAGKIMNIVLLVASVTFFTFLILKDVVKGLKSKAHWIPGDFLVLSALTIQLLNLISTQGRPLTLKERDITLNEFWLIHTSRILLCVVVGYLVPAMANPGSEDFWGKIMGLALTVFLHVITELYILNPASTGTYLEKLWPKQKGTNLHLYYVLATLIFFSFLLLLLLLGCANIAGRGIERIIAKTIPTILKEQAEKNHQHPANEKEDHHFDFRCDECWQRVEDSVLRAWIVARAYSLEHVISRSALAASAATIITIQIAITILAGVWNSPKMLLCNTHDKLRFCITMLQCLFILIGWSMILWRWVTAVAYYGSWNSPRFQIEDFWTRHLRELVQAKQDRLPKAQLLEAKIGKLVVNQSTQITLNKYLLYVVIVLQLFAVSFSKVCWFGSLVLFHNYLTGKLLSFILSKITIDYYRYCGVLGSVQILGETSLTLWLSNRESIPNAAALILQGKEDGEIKCQSLVDFVGRKRTGRGLGLSCLDPYKTQTGLKYLCKRSPVEEAEELQVEKFTDVSTKQWKLTAVSLLSIIVHLSPSCAEIENEQPSTSGSLPPSVVKDCLESYSQAWEIIDFVDEADTEAKGFTSEAADNYFSLLRKKASKSKKSTPPETVTAVLADLRNESKRKMESPGYVKANQLKSKGKTEGVQNGLKGNDSIDWNAEAVGRAVYELCNSIDCNEETHVTELLKELESCLADIINECLEKIQHLLLMNSMKWAVDADESRIAKALYITGKARVVMKNLETKRNIVMEERSGSAINLLQG